MRTSTCQTGMGVPGHLRKPSRQSIRMLTRAVPPFQGMAITCISVRIVKAVQEAMTFMWHAGIMDSGGRLLPLEKQSTRLMTNLGLPLRVMAGVCCFPRCAVTRTMRISTWLCSRRRRRRRRQVKDCHRCLSLSRPSRCWVISIRVPMISRRH